jgi:uncharacterized membrane protein
VNPDRFRILVSGVLIVGVSIAAILIGIGFVGSLLVGWEGSLSGAAPGNVDVTAFGRLGESLGALRPIAFAQLGLVVLLATPVVRVGASVVAFALEGDRLYAGITLVVLLILLTSLFIPR